MRITVNAVPSGSVSVSSGSSSNVLVEQSQTGTVSALPGDRSPASIVIKNYTVDNVTTSEIEEGVNLYFSNARAIAALSAGQSITIDANGRINSTATGGSSSYTDSNARQAISVSGAGTYDNTTGIITINTSSSAYNDANVYSNVVLLNYITSSALNGYATNTQLASYATNSQLALYATNAQLTSYATVSNVALKSNIVDLTTANVTELTNLYFTNARVYTNVTQLGYITSSALSGYATSAQLSNTDINVTASYNQANAAVSQASSALLRAIAANSLANVAFYQANAAYDKANTGITSASLTTANVSELTNLYFTNARSRLAISVSGAGSYDNATGVITINTSSSTYGDANTYSNVVLLNYITSSSLSGYATNAQLATYATNAQLATYATNAQLALYATNAQLNSYATTTNVALKANIVDLTTANVTEVTNRYFTNARVVSAVSTNTLGNISTGNIVVSGTYDGISITGDRGNMLIGNNTRDGVIRYALNSAQSIYAGMQIQRNGTEAWFSGVNTTENFVIRANSATDILTISSNGTITVSGSINGYAANTQLAVYATNAQLTSYATTANLELKANIVDLTTANVTEVTNQYFTNARAVEAVVNTTLSNITVSGNIVTSGTGGNLTMTGGYITGANGIITTATTFDLANTTATTVNFAGAATTLTMGASSGNTTVKNGLYVTGTLYNVDTSEITESTNLYFTNARSYANVTALGYATTANLTTANVTEVTNQYFTNARAVAAVTASSISVAGGVTANAATAFIAGDAAISGVALQIPHEGGIRNTNNGLSNMYIDVSTGGTTHGQFQFRSGSTFTNVLTMSPTAFNVSTDATVTARTPSLGRLPWNSALDTELTIDDMRFRISNQGGIFPQVIGNGSSRNLAWTVIAARSGSAVTQTGSTGTIVSSSAWTSLYTSAGMDSAGDTYTTTLQDKAAGRIYRVTFMRSDNGSTTGYNIIAERIL